MLFENSTEQNTRHSDVVGADEKAASHLETERRKKAIDGAGGPDEGADWAAVLFQNLVESR